MESTQASSRQHELMAWGLLAVWWGLRNWLLADLPNGSGLIGTGLILLAVKAIGSLRGIPAGTATTSYALFALAWGALLLVGGEVFHQPVEIFVFESFLIALGAVLLLSAVRVRRDASEA